MMAWLREVQSAADIPFVPASDVKQPGSKTNERAALAAEMLGEVPQGSPADSEEWRGHSLLAALFLFHRREEKQPWGLLFLLATVNPGSRVAEPPTPAATYASDR